MIWLFMCIIALVILVMFAVYIQPDVIELVYSNAGIPHINIVWILLGSILFLLLGLLLVYLDSRQALTTLTNGDRGYIVLPRRIGRWLWNDTVNAYAYSSLTGFIGLLAKLVLIVVVFKYILMAILWLLLFVPPVVYSSFLGNIQPYLKQWIGILLPIFIDKYGMLTFAFSIIVLCAEWLHVREQTFYNDYAIMQHQRDE